MKFKGLKEKYFEKAKIELKLRSYLLYLHLYQTHLSQELDNMKVRNVAESTIINILKSKEKRLSKSTIKILLCLLNNIFEYANKCLKLKFCHRFRIKIKTEKKAVESLSKNEQVNIEKYIMNNKSIYHYGILIALYTGLRIGEILALTWKDVDFKRKTLNINKSVCSLNINNKLQTHIDTTKTVAGTRIVPISNSLFAIIKELKEISQSQFVVSNKGKQIYVRVYQQSFYNLLKKLKIRHYGFNSLRHTFATRSIECGMDIKSLSEILGHSSVGVTLNRYVHSSLERKSQLMNKVGKMLRENQSFNYLLDD